MGKWVNGTPPFPYRYNTKTRELEVDEINLEIYKLIKRMISSGNSCYKVAEELNTRGIPSKKKGEVERRNNQRNYHFRGSPRENTLRKNLGKWPYRQKKTTFKT